MPDNITRTAEENAAEFAALSKQGKDLRLALLVACSVEKGTRGGDRANPKRGLRVDAASFGRKAGTKGDRVLRHLEAWDKFAKLVKLPLAAKLTPGDAVTLDIPPALAEKFDDISLDSKGGAVKGLSQKAADIANNRKAMTEAIQKDPKVAAAAAAALPPEAVVKRVAEPAVAQQVASNNAAASSVFQAKTERRRQIVRTNKEQRTTKTAAQQAAVEDAAGAAALPSHSADLNAMESAFVDMRTRWRQGAKTQSFTDMDLAYLPVLAQHLSDVVEEMDAFNEAQAGGSDPYATVKAILQARVDEHDIEIDLWEQGMQPDAIDEIERYANQASS